MAESEGSPDNGDHWNPPGIVRGESPPLLSGWIPRNQFRRRRGVRRFMHQPELYPGDGVGIRSLCRLASASANSANRV